MPREKGIEAIFKEYIDLIDDKQLFHLGRHFDEESSKLYYKKGVNQGNGEQSIRTQAYNELIRNGTNGYSAADATLLESMQKKAKKAKKALVNPVRPYTVFEPLRPVGRYLDLYDIDLSKLPLLIVPQHGEDVKACIGNSFRGEGSEGRVRTLIIDIERVAHDEGIDVRDVIAAATFSETCIRETFEPLSPRIAELIRNTLDAKHLIKHYPGGIRVVNAYGHIRVPIEDYTNAFKFTGIKKGIIGYSSLQAPYVRWRIEQLSALQDVPNSVTVDGSRHHPDEVVPVAAREAPPDVCS